MPNVFVERLERFTCGLRRGVPHQGWERTLGGGDEGDGPEGWEYRYRPDWGAELLGDSPPHSSQLEARFLEVARALEAQGLTAGAERVEVLFRETTRTIAAGRQESPARDARTTVLLELRLHAGAGAAAQTTLLEHAFTSTAELFASPQSLAPAIARRAEDVRRKLESVPAPEGEPTVLIPPGADAGVIFHELCGHPLEGDVVARHSSFLARRLGQQVAPDFVTVVDDPTRDARTVGYQVDDEGSEGRVATLLRAGRADEPLLDARSASTLQRSPNGHGRRSTFKRFALPRMSHTELRPHQGTFEQLLSGIERGVCVGYLTPRRVDLLSGDFSFLCPEARLIENGKLGAFLRPALLEGNGLEALAAIDAVGADLETFQGMKGCGKLDQGGLPVSFGNPSVRFTRLKLRPAP